MFKFLKRMFRSSTRAQVNTEDDREANEDRCADENRESETEGLITVGTKMRYL